MSKQKIVKRSVVFSNYDEKFFRYSGLWLSDPEISFLTNTPEISVAERCKWFGSLSERSDYLIFGVSFNRVPVGVCGLKNISDGKTGEYFGFIGDKAYWGNGIGSEMIKYIESVAVERGLRIVLLRVIPQNRSAIKLYEKHGFRSLGREPKSQSLIMDKILNYDDFVS